jgi:hypothetical protein
MRYAFKAVMADHRFLLRYIGFIPSLDRGQGNLGQSLGQKGENITTKSTKDRKKNLVIIPRLGAGT